MMMRPYQIYAVKQIVDCIHQNCGNGYIWDAAFNGTIDASKQIRDLFSGVPEGRELARSSVANYSACS
jgi:type I restriction enzyme R subunit